MLVLIVLLPSAVSPLAETVETIEGTVVTGSGALRATLNVTVMSGKRTAEPKASLRVQVRVAKVQLQPVPLKAVAVSPGTRVMVSVTVPVVAELPKLKIEVLRVTPVAP